MFSVCAAFPTALPWRRTFCLGLQQPAFAFSSTWFSAALPRQFCLGLGLVKLPHPYHCLCLISFHSIKEFLKALFFSYSDLSCSYHLHADYADDNQLHISFTVSDLSANILHLPATIYFVSNCISLNLLSLNQAKTEFILMGLPAKPYEIADPILLILSKVTILSVIVVLIGFYSYPAFCGMSIRLIPFCRMSIRLLIVISPNGSTNFVCS